MAHVESASVRAMKIGGWSLISAAVTVRIFNLDVRSTNHGSTEGMTSVRENAVRNAHCGP